MKSRLRLSEAVKILFVRAWGVGVAWQVFGVVFGGWADARTAAPGPGAASSTAAGPAPSTPPAPSTSQAPPVTLSVLVPDDGVRGDQEYWDQIVQDFQTSHPRVTVSVRRVARSALVGEARSGFAAGSVDVVLGVYADDVATAAGSGQLYQQYDLVPPSKGMLPDFNYREEGSGPGGNPLMLGIPFSGSVLELYCNMSLFASAGIGGPPTTWSQLAADAAKIKAAGAVGYGLAMAPGDAAATAQMWMGGDGGRGFSSAPGNRGWSVGMPANVQALSWLDENLVKPGRTEPHPGAETTQDLERQFVAGKIGMMLADSTLFPQTQDAGLGNAVRVVPMPGIAGPVNGTVGSVDDFLASNAHPERKDAIASFLDYMLTPPNNTRYAQIHGTLPLTQAGVDLARTEYPATQPFLTQLTQIGWLPTRNPAWPTVQNAIATMLPKALTSDPQPILDRIQAIAMAASPAR